MKIEVTVEVTVCDIDPDPEVPAKRYSITADDGRTVTRELCPNHAEPFEALLREEDPGPEGESESDDGPPPVRVRGHGAVPRKTAAAKKAAAKKTAAEPGASSEEEPAPAGRRRRRPPVTTMAQIEQKKAARGN
ncbi:hypothetical protein [Streptomyces sp. NBC_01198]|uniref:hypothetical protein n=1 Tax=Streptomyces sp. NBC_01198 TaxID=2903769 RepID=UPI002E0DD99C|nr:hypothetical protein OG702_31965 [Streptomyces sp. NBC_01198]